MFLSVFDLFKIGVGPSSSHTMGPMVASNMFLDEIASDNWPKPAHTAVTQLRVSLHGSLAYTGKGHATDRAVILGLLGFSPATINPDDMDTLIEQVNKQKVINLIRKPILYLIMKIFFPAIQMVWYMRGWILTALSLSAAFIIPSVADLLSQKMN